MEKWNYLVVVFFVIFMIYEQNRRRKLAESIAKKWVLENASDLKIKDIKDVKASLLSWPVTVLVTAINLSGEQTAIKLKVGTVFGGVFMDKVKFVSTQKA